MEDFDVFLNHRGPDIKATFVPHLEEALRYAGFRPFLDARSLMKGNPALKSIDQALDRAKVHVAVVCRRYAESKYCLNELVAMMRIGKPVIPVFYDVEPVDLRWVRMGHLPRPSRNTSPREKARKKFKSGEMLAGPLRSSQDFAWLIINAEDVVDEVARLRPSNQPLEVEQYRVCLEGPTKSCVELLEDMGDGVGLLGLVGVGGVGKTTLAREIYNYFEAANKFKCMTFLEIHGDPSSSNVQDKPTWLRNLQRQLLWDLLRVQDSSSNYRFWFQKASNLGPVFIVIDDVHNLNQFDTIVPSSLCVFHPGSRIVVTARDRSTLDNVAGRMNILHHVYYVSAFTWNESSILFNWHAFHAKEAPEDYKDLAEDVVRACGGLPLILKVVGSSLFDKRLDGDRETIWPEAMDALRQRPDVMGALSWSYDSLTESEKRMFLDITCLFYDRSAKDAFAYWEGCTTSTSYGGIHTPHTSLRNLIKKNLVFWDVHSVRSKSACPVEHWAKRLRGLKDTLFRVDFLLMIELQFVFLK